MVFAGWLFKRLLSSSGNGCLALGRLSSSSNGRYNRTGLVIVGTSW